jgi:BarA-like signal transduction histidine kinase
MNDWEGFELGFWHPFLTACLGAAGKNLARKKRKNEENRLTLRSFNHSNLEVWYQELIAANPHKYLYFAKRGRRHLTLANRKV